MLGGIVAVLLKKLLFALPTLISAGLCLIAPVKATTTWGPNNAPPFNVINITSGSTYTVQSLNALETNIFWNSSSGLAKALSLKGCSAADKGNVVNIIDRYGDASGHNITITPSSGTINSATTYVLDLSNATASFICDGSSNWLTNRNISSSAFTYFPLNCDGFKAEDGVTYSSQLFTSASATFSSTDVGKIISINDAGTTQYINHAVISAAGTGYVPNDEITLTGGTQTQNTKLLVRTTKVVSATVAAGGSGGTPGTQTVTGTTGTGTKFTASVTVSGGGVVTAVLSITTGGSYYTNPTTLAAEPVTGANLSGAQLNVVMGINTVSGKAGTLGKYTVVPGNPVSQGSTTGSGVGGTFTVTWQRDNLVTTIASVVDAHTVTLTSSASGSGAAKLWGYGTDYSTLLNTAIAATKPVRLPQGICGVASTINIRDLQSLLGNGTGGRLTSASSLMWLGAVDGTVLNLSAADGGPANGLNVGPFNVYAMGAASKGVTVKGIIHSPGIRITSQDPKDYAFILAEGDNGNQDTFFNDFYIKAVVNHEYSRNAVGYSFPKALLSSGAHDVNGNNFYNFVCYGYDGTCVDFQEGSGNVFYTTQIFANTTGIGYGIWFGGSSAVGGNTLRAHDNLFVWAISEGPIKSEGGTFPALGNRIYNLDLQAFLTTIVLDADSVLYCTVTGSTTLDFGGSENYCTPHAFKRVIAGSPAGTATTANYVAMGVGGTFSPKYSGNIDIGIAGSVGNDTPGDGVIMTIYFGTGTPPANGDNIETAGTTRFQCGNFPALSNTPSASFKTPFHALCTIPGLSRITTYWWDLGVKATTAGTANIYNVFSRATELP